MPVGYSVNFVPVWNMVIIATGMENNNEMQFKIRLRECKRRKGQGADIR